MWLIYLRAGWQAPNEQRVKSEKAANNRSGLFCTAGRNLVAAPGRAVWGFRITCPCPLQIRCSLGVMRVSLGKGKECCPLPALGASPSDSSKGRVSWSRYPSPPGLTASFIFKSCFEATLIKTQRPPAHQLPSFSSPRTHTTACIYCDHQLLSA